MPNRYNRLENQSPAQSQLEAKAPSVGRSSFDYSFIHNGNTLIGALTPVACIDTVPNEDFDISLSSVIEFRNPTTRQLFNGFRVYFHARYNRLVDLWEGAKNWLDLGRSGKISLDRPNLIFSKSVHDVYVNACTPMSLLNFLGLPSEYMNHLVGSVGSFPPLRSFQPYKNSVARSEEDKLNNHVEFFPADCAMAYQRNWRDFYSNKNLLQNNKYWFPDNEDHFILSYSCRDAVAINYEDEDFSTVGGNNADEWQFENIFGNIYTAANRDTLTPEPNNPSTGTISNRQGVPYPNLSGLKFVQFRGDRFTTGCPFPDLIRGDIPSLATVGVNDRLRIQHPDGSSSLANFFRNSATDNNELGFVQSPGYTAPLDSEMKLISGASSVTMSDLYTLETLTAFKRKMGMTNGDYNEMIKAQFGYDPHTHDRTGTYVGGFYQDFALSSVTQTSQSDQSPLGTKAGQGVSSGSGRIGHFHSPDYGWLQIYMFIVPDVYYTQGKPRMFSKRSNLEMYFPLFNNLPAQAIKNEELLVSSSSTVNDSPFAYEDRYAEFKSHPNVVTGFMALPHDVAEYDSSRIMARRFTSAPALNSQFVTLVPENQDMEVFTVYDEPPFDFSIGFSIRRVSPMPYIAIEGSLSSPRLNA